MQDPRLQLRSPALAAILALLLPGAGHWYQGRRFKAVLFSVCILLTYFTGLVLGAGQPVYSATIVTPPTDLLHDSAQQERGGARTRLRYGYAAQFLVGVPSFPAILQSIRIKQDPGSVTFLEEPIQSEFIGTIVPVNEFGNEDASASAPVRGTIELNPIQSGGSHEVTGVLTGTMEDGTSVTLDLSGSLSLGRKVFGSPWRDVRGLHVTDPQDPEFGGKLCGSIERSFVDWFQAPRDDAELNRLHGEYGNTYDVA
ncbi:MAG: hypothetical protein KDA96_24560, partial [Planctomycetaceae bacterium]|nr:hypothetical protein [Planctomycetaceae bacterium]